MATGDHLDGRASEDAIGNDFDANLAWRWLAAGNEVTLNDSWHRVKESNSVACFWERASPPMSKVSKDGTAVEFPNGVKVHCPEDGMAMQSPVKVEFNGNEIVCHDARSLLNAISMTLNTLSPRKQGDGKQGSGPERAWAEAREYAKAYNKDKPESEHITDNQARITLAQQKQEQKLQALLKKRK